MTDDNTDRFRSTEWSLAIVAAARSMYRRLRLADPDLPKWSRLSVDATDHYCVAAQNAVETFHFEASKPVQVWRNC